MMVFTLLYSYPRHYITSLKNSAFFTRREFTTSYILNSYLHKRKRKTLEAYCSTYQLNGTRLIFILYLKWFNPLEILLLKLRYFCIEFLFYPDEGSTE